jgi:iron-sulfur cluster repair protein YtfE (RIC family)
MNAREAAVQSTSADEARATILGQHQEIRILLRTVASVARLAAAGNRRIGETLGHYLQEIRDVLEAHLTMEEGLLLPILESDPPLGPERAQRLRQEHARQRAELAALATEGRRALAPAELAWQLDALVRELLADMDGEERSLLTPDVVRDDLISVDQATG